MRLRRALVLATVGLLAQAAGCGPPATSGTDGARPRGGRGVLVLAVDALRYDHTSFAGYDRDTTPNLDAFAESEAFVFHEAWACAPTIIPSHVSLLTGCDPAVALRPNVVLTDGTVLPPLNKWTIPRDVPTLAAAFLADGWRTAAFMDHPYVRRKGFDYGFREFHEAGGSRDERGTGKPEWGLAGVAIRFGRWIRGLDEDEDWFAYVHMNDFEKLWDEELWHDTGHPELPPAFEPRPELELVPPIGVRSPIYHALPPAHALPGQPTLADYEVRYDTALAWFDRNLVRIFGLLEDEGRWERTTVVIVGSFGIDFGESGFVVDWGGLSDVDLHVPLVLKPAAELELEPGGSSEALVSLMDVPPTLLELSRLPVPEGMHGRSLVPLLRGTRESVREVAYASFGHADGYAVIDPRYTFSVTLPGSRGIGALSSSWFGDERRHPRDEVVVLKDRDADPAPGHLGRGIVDAVRAEYLRGLGRAWYADLERVREVLHPTAWNADKRGPEVIDELRTKGLVDVP